MEDIGTLFTAVMIVVWAVVLLCSSCLVGVAIGEERIKDAAVKSGHAEYYLDEKNERQWRWKP